MKLHKIATIASLFLIVSITDLLSDPNPDAQANTESKTGSVATTPQAPTKKSQRTKRTSLFKKPEIEIFPGDVKLRTVYNPNNTITKTASSPDKTTQIVTLSSDSTALLSKKELDERNNLIKSLRTNPDKTITITISNPDETKTIQILNANKTLLSTTNVDIATNRIINRTITNPDKTQTRTDFYSDGSQLITVLDVQKNEMTSRTFIRADGTKTSMDGKLATAMHEAAHGVSFINNRSIRTIDTIGIQADTTPTNVGNGIHTGENGHIAGANYVYLTYLVNKNIQELENNIMTNLAGGVADQIALSQDMLTNPKDILQFFSHPAYTGDLPAARQDAQAIIMQNSPNLSDTEMQKQIDAMIVSSYKKTYQFITKHKADIVKLANALTEKGIMSGDEVYNLLEANKPLYDFQEGPLPLSLVEDYKLRGWATSDEQRTSLFDKNAQLTDDRRYSLGQDTHGNKFETKYYVNGNKAIEIQTAPDGTKTKASYDINEKKTQEIQTAPDGSESITKYYDNVQYVNIFDATGTLIGTKIIPAPTETPPSVDKVQAASKEPLLIIDQAHATEPILHATTKDNQASSITSQATAKENLNPAMINAHQQELQARQSQPHEQLAEAKGF